MQTDSISYPSAARPASRDRRTERRAAFASIIGTTIEWYDFFIYGTAAALVFPKVFFAHAGVDGVMESFATIFVGFIARPLGGALFGYMGDRVGRKSTLVATLLLMGVATVLVGLLPTGDKLGSLAGWLLIGLRVLQGIGVGGEWGGAVLLSMESHTGKRRGFMASLPNIGVPLGLVISVLVWSACSRWADGVFLDYGWRIPFLASGVMLVVGLLIRLGVPETLDFIEANKGAKREKGPITEAIRTEWRAILLSALIRPSEQTAFYMITSFAILYCSKNLGLGKEFILNAVLIAAVVACFALPFFGYVADKVGRCKTYTIGTVCMMLFAFPYFALLNTRLPIAVIAATIIIMVIHASIYGSQASFIAESFPAHIRYSGASLGYQGGSIIAGGPAAMISLWLFQTYHTVYAVAAYMAVSAFVSAIAAVYLGRTKNAARVSGVRTLVGRMLSLIFSRKCDETEVRRSPTSHPLNANVPVVIATTSKPRIFITGGTGYIGGSFIHLMLQRDYLSRFDIAVLVRQDGDASRLRTLGIEPVLGSLNDHELLRGEAARASVVFNTANCDHQASAVAIVRGLTQRARSTGERPILIHTSGAGVLSDTSTGTGVSPQQDPRAEIWDDADSAAHAAIPDHAPHRFVDLEVFAAARTGLVKTYLVVPPTVFGGGLGPFAERRMSIQIPRLIYQSLMRRKAMYVGSGENVWPNVHVADLAELYLLIFEGALNGTAPEGMSGLFYPVTEHFTWSTVSHRVAQVLHAKQLLSSALATTGLQQGWFWGSNVRVVSSNGVRLGWSQRHGGTNAMLDGVESDLALVMEMIRAHNAA